MKYVIAVLACVGVFIAYVLIGAAVFGWQHGGGLIPMMILFAIVGAVWRKITKSKTSKNTSNAGCVEKANSESDSSAITYETDTPENSDEDNGIKTPEIQTAFQVEPKIKASDGKKPSIAAEQADMVKMTQSEETKNCSINHQEAPVKDEEYVKWFSLALLIIVLIAIIVVRFVETPEATRAVTSVESLSKMVSSVPKRDLSTPSNRIVGHWVNIDNGGEIYYSPIDRSLGIGTFRLKNFGGSVGPPIRFKIVFEEYSGKSLIIRIFNKAIDELGAKIGIMVTQSDVELCISKDGQSMTEEYTLNGSPIFGVYRYVDDKTIP